MKKDVKRSTQRPSFFKNIYSGHLLLCLVLTLAAFWNVLSNDYGFVNRDDNIYVYRNKLITSLSAEHIGAIFTSPSPVYQPVTTLSYAIEYALHGLDAEKYHTVNILLHLLCTTLVFLLSLRLSGGRKEVAAIAALLFGIHPMHVESVSWISGRKDLLYTVFYISALLAYNKYLDDLKKQKYLGMAFILFLFSVLSKEMAVTLPVALLLMDWYRDRPINKSAWVEKIPFFLLSVAIGIVAVIVQRQVSKVDYETHYILSDRLLFMSNALVTYIAKLIIPVHLSAYNPWPVKVNGYYPTAIYTSPFLLLALFGAGIVLFRKSVNSRKILLFGTGFFLLNIALVLQWLPVGDSYIAERYTYLSYAGLLFSLSAAAGNTLMNSKLKPVILTILGAWLIFLFFTTRERNVIWSNSKTFWTDAANKNPNNPRVYNLLGNVYLLLENKPDSAKMLLRKSLSIEPTAGAFSDLGHVFLQEGNYAMAVTLSDSGILLNKDLSSPYEVKGIALSQLGKQDAAIATFKKCLHLDHPNPASIYLKIGLAYNDNQQYDSAIAACSRALLLDDKLANAYMIRSDAYLMTGQYELSAQDSIDYMQLSAMKK